MSPLDLVRLTPLIDRNSGRAEVRIGLIDGPVAMNHPELDGRHVRQIEGRPAAACSRTNSLACLHGTFVAGILAARRGSGAPAICPDCTLLVRPIFSEDTADGGMPSAKPEELARAIHDCVDQGARVLNISAAIGQPSINAERTLEDALDRLASRGIIVIVSAGNQGTLGSTALTRHPWVIPVISYDLRGRPMDHSNLGASIARRGLGAPGDGVSSLGAEGKPLTLGGTSAAAPFVTGAVALLWSEFPNASAADIKLATCGSGARRSNTVVPPLLDAWGAYRQLLGGNPGGRSV